MPSLLVAQSLLNYGSLSSVSATFEQLWNITLDRAANVDQMVWIAVGGVLILVSSLWGMRPPQ